MLWNRKSVKSAFFLVLSAFLFASCKPRISQSEVMGTGAAKPPVFAQVPTDPVFTQLVQNKNYQDALSYVCARFPQLNCSSHNFKINTRTDSGTSAITSVVNTITLYPSAFVHDRDGAILPGWTAAIIWHEITHTKQSLYIRWLVSGAQKRFLGNYRYDAGLELEGWESMLDPDQFPMNCGMIFDIQSNIYRFNKILQNGGSEPKDEDDEEQNYSLSTQKMDQIYRDCHDKLNARYGTSGSSLGLTADTPYIPEAQGAGDDAAIPSTDTPTIEVTAISDELTPVAFDDMESQDRGFTPAPYPGVQPYAN